MSLLHTCSTITSTFIDHVFPFLDVHEKFAVATLCRTTYNTLSGLCLFMNDALDVLDEHDVARLFNGGVVHNQFNNGWHITGISLTTASLTLNPFLDLIRFNELIELELVGCTNVVDWSVLRAAPRLESLAVYAPTFHPSKLTNLNDLENCHNLVSLRLCNADNLTDLSGLSACPALEALVIDGCAVEDLFALRQCRNLVHVALNAPKLRRVDGLSGLRKLQHLLVRGAWALEDVSPLVSCPRLETITLNRCGALRGLGELCSLPGLEYLSVDNVRGDLARKGELESREEKTSDDAIRPEMVA